MSFCLMVASVTHSRTSHVQTTQDVFLYIERPRPKLSYVKIWGQQLRYVILHICDLERPRSSLKFKNFLSSLHHLPISTHVKFQRNLMPVFLLQLEQRWPGERKNIRRNSLTDANSTVSREGGSTSTGS